VKLIPNWRRAWRMASVQFAAVAVAWGSLPTETQTSILSAIGMPAERVPAVLGLLILAGRLIDQPKAH
jgi:hypothetical protein